MAVQLDWPWVWKLNTSLPTNHELQDLPTHQQPKTPRLFSHPLSAAVLGHGNKSKVIPKLQPPSDKTFNKAFYFSSTVSCR